MITNLANPVSAGSVTDSLAADTKGLNALRYQAKQDPVGSVRAAAQQFEALFIQAMLKSMRETTGQDGMFDNEQTRLYTSMLDQQMAQNMSARGIGLADMMSRQLMFSMNAESAPSSAPSSADGVAPLPQSAALCAEGCAMQRPIGARALSPIESSGGVVAGAAGGPRAFAERIWPHAAEAGQSTGIPPHFIVAHAALESAWGKAEIVGQDGSRSYNLFGIKAGPGWNGKVVESVTTEFVHGIPQKSVEKFRAYDSYSEAFRDYAGVLRANPRYANALQNHGDPSVFARGLQQGGYATDPAYADKLMGVLAGATIRQFSTLSG